MPDKKYSILINSDLRPTYYDDFHCLASECRFTCCKGWRVTFDKKDYLSLKRVEGSPELNANMEKTLRRLKKGSIAEQYYAEFDLDGGCCPLQREDGLCSLQLEKGPDALPRVCRIFPRGEGYVISGYFERGLSPACEGVLELLWNLPEGVGFVSDPLPEREHKKINFDNPLYIRFQDVRARCIDILQDRRLPLPRRILLMGVALKELVDGESDIDRWLVRTHSLVENPEAVEQLGETDLSRTLPMFLSNNIRVLLSLLDVHSDFAHIREELLAGLGVVAPHGIEHATVPIEPYLSAQKRFEETFAAYDFFMENIMVALFFHMHLPIMDSREEMWKSYVNFCNLYSFYRFMAVMSCREGASGDKAELFRLMVCASRGLIHNHTRQDMLRDELFQHDSATLAHMAILLAG